MVFRDHARVGLFGLIVTCPLRALRYFPYCAHAQPPHFRQPPGRLPCAGAGGSLSNILPGPINPNQRLDTGHDSDMCDVKSCNEDPRTKSFVDSFGFKFSPATLGANKGAAQVGAALKLPMPDGLARCSARAMMLRWAAKRDDRVGPDDAQHCAPLHLL